MVLKGQLAVIAALLLYSPLPMCLLLPAAALAAVVFGVGVEMVAAAAVAFVAGKLAEPVAASPSVAASPLVELAAVAVGFGLVVAAGDGVAVEVG